MAETEPSTNPHDVTRILNALETDADPRESEQLLPLVYEELRNLARSRMHRENVGQTIQATALVHEAYLRVADDPERTWDNRRHFFGAAAEAMRRILIDRARAKGSQKRGGDWERLPIEAADIGIDIVPDQLLEVDEALEKLELQDPDAAKLVKLRFFAGLKLKEAAEVMGMAERSAQRLWAYARTWLFQAIKGK